MNHEVEFHGLLSVFASNSRVQLSQTMLRVYDLAVQPFGYERACRALEQLLMETKNWQMPPPKSIIEKIENKPSKLAEANEVAGRIMQSISKFGYNRGNDAKEFIGPLGWIVVERFGGWYNLCVDMGVGLDPSSSRAQMRDSALSLLELSEHRNLDEAPALPAPKENNKLQSAIKLIAQAKEIPK